MLLNLWLKLQKKMELKDLYMHPQVRYMDYQRRNVKENRPLVPLTLYNKYKGM